MAKGGGFKKGLATLLCLVSLGGAVVGLTGCSESKEQAAAYNNVNTVMTQSINQSGKFADELNSFNFVSSNHVYFEETDSYQLNIYGTFKAGSPEKQYISLAKYDVDLIDLDMPRTSDNVKFANKLAEAIERSSLASFEATQIDQLEKIGKAIPKAIIGKYVEARVKFVSAPEFNEQNGYAMFKTECYFETKEVKSGTAVGPVFGGGGVGIGFGFYSSSKNYELNQKDNIIIKLNSEEMAEAKSNPQLVYEKFIELSGSVKYNNKGEIKSKPDDIVIVNESTYLDKGQFKDPYMNEDFSK